MPFVPLNPEEKKRFPKPCRHREHHPPSHMVIREVMKWKCPGCGHEVIIRPLQYSMFSGTKSYL